MVSGALVILAVFFGISAVFVEQFQQNGAAIATVILGALTTMASIMTGSYFMRDIKKAPQQEADKAQEPEKDGATK